MRPLIILTILMWALGIAEAQVERPGGVGAEQTVSVHMFDRGMQGFSRPPAEWQGKARRITKSIVSNYGEGKPLGRVSEIREFDTVGSSRHLTIVDSPYQKSEQESISVGHDTFVRWNRGAWQRKDREHYGLAIPPAAPFETTRTGPPGTFRFLRPEATFEFKVGTAVFKGEVLLIYVRTIFSSNPGKEPGTVFELEQTNRYWLADSGRLVKLEDVQINRKTGAGTQSIQEWELDPSIRIEAPAYVK